MKATADPSQTYCQPDTAPNAGLSAQSHSSASVSTVYPINHRSAITKKQTASSIAKNKSVKTFHGLDNQNIIEEYLRQKGAHMIFTSGEPPLDLVASNQWHKKCPVFSALFLWNRFKVVFMTS